MTIKKYEDWKGNLGDYLKVGDFVDTKIYNHFINVLPPMTFNNEMVQMGEPYSISPEGKPTFMTLIYTSGGWKYVGYCLAGCSKNVSC